MDEKRCAWCGEKMGDHQDSRTFCSKFCQKLFENWCRNRADTRADAVHRWRNPTSQTMVSGHQVPR